MTGGPIFLNNTYSGSELPVIPKNPIIKFFEKNKNFMEHYYSQWYHAEIDQKIESISFLHSHYIVDLFPLSIS